MTLPAWLPPATAFAISATALFFAVNLGWSITTWNMQRREKIAEKARKPRLKVTFNGQTTLEFVPIGGHRTPGGVTMFEPTIENGGDAAAEDVVAYVFLPSWMHPAPLPDLFRIFKGKEIHFEYGGLKHPSADGGTIRLPRPLYPGQLESLGFAVVQASGGKFRIDWRIESNFGPVESDNDTALFVIIRDEAIGHDHVSWIRETQDHDRSKCFECVRVAALSPQELNDYIKSLGENG